MKHYTLYLDESETFNQNNNHFFSVSGVIFDKSINSLIDKDLNALKRQLWPSETSAESFILHEKEISAAQRNRNTDSTYNIFRSNNACKKLYMGLSKIITNYDITIIGTCIDITKLTTLYPGSLAANKFKIAIQLLLENYCHFLMYHNATGDICYESLQEPGNQELRQRFYELEALGTMYYTSNLFQTHIGDICFKEKTENISGLQLADFIPNTFARNVAGLNPKHRDFKKSVFKKAYDGGLNMPYKFGLKIIP